MRNNCTKCKFAEVDRFWGLVCSDRNPERAMAEYAGKIVIGRMRLDERSTCGAFTPEVEACEP